MILQNLSDSEVSYIILNLMRITTDGHFTLFELIYPAVVKLCIVFGMACNNQFKVDLNKQR